MPGHQHQLDCSCDWERQEDGSWWLTKFDDECTVHEAIREGDVEVNEEVFGRDFTIIPSDVAEQNARDSGLVPDDLPWNKDQQGEISMQDAMSIADSLDQADETVQYELPDTAGEETNFDWDELREAGWEAEGEVRIIAGHVAGTPACFVVWSGGGMNIYAARGYVETALDFIEKSLGQSRDLD